MKKRPFNTVLFSAVFLICLFTLSAVSLAKEIRQKWELLNPEGVVKIDPMKITPHPSTLEGKTVMLRWNGKHNGDKFLERVGELLRNSMVGNMLEALRYERSKNLKRYP